MQFTLKPFASLILVVTFCSIGCGNPNPQPLNLSRGVSFKPAIDDSFRKQLADHIGNAAERRMQSSGLVGAIGGATVKIWVAGTHQLLLPIPQLTESQIPLAYSINCEPPNSLLEYRIHRREAINDVLVIRIEGVKGQEIRFEWVAAVLLHEESTTSTEAESNRYAEKSACAQSDSIQIETLSNERWPTNGGIKEYAANIQSFVREMKQQHRPRSLDALGILESGANGICTANVNLSLALFRFRHIPCRSVAVIPSTSQRLEMHRVVEYVDDSEWRRFDPSSVHAEVPMMPWHSVVMSRTTKWDEETSMDPRMGTMVGCPYGQELELLTPGVTFSGQDFFWTKAKPIAEFEPRPESVAAARAEWKRFLAEGTLSPIQLEATFALGSDDFHDRLKGGSGEVAAQEADRNGVDASEEAQEELRQD